MRLHFLLADASETLRRRRFHLLVPWLVFVLGGILTAYLLPERYEAFSTVIVQRDASPGGADRLGLFREIVQSRSVLAAAADSLHGGRTAASRPPGQEDVALLMTAVTTEQLGPDALRITAVHADPGEARRIAEVVTGIAIAVSAQADRRQLDEAVHFYEKKLAEYEQTQRRNETTPGVTQPGGSAMALRGALSRASGDLQEAEAVSARIDQALVLLRTASETLDDRATLGRLAAMDNRSAGRLAEQIRAASARYTNLLTRYRPLHPEVQSARRQLLGLLDKAGLELESERSQAQTRMAEIQRRQRQLREQLAAAPSEPSAEAAQPTPSGVSRDIIPDLRRQLEQARVARDLRTQAGSRLTVLDRPQTADSPASPDRPLIIGLAAILGLLAGLAAVMAAESLDTTIRRPRDLETFGKPVIATLP